MLLNIILNIIIIVTSFSVTIFFARKGAQSYIEAIEQISHENEFYTEIILGLETLGKNICEPRKVSRKIRIAIWELYNNLKVQPLKDNKIITLQRKMLNKRQSLYHNMEQGKVVLEILPFIGIIGTLLGFAVPYFINQIISSKLTFNITGFGFFLAASSTIFALLCLIYLKKRYEAKILSAFDYFESQEKALEKIMVECDGFRLLEKWLKELPKKSQTKIKKVNMICEGTEQKGFFEFID